MTLLLSHSGLRSAVNAAFWLMAFAWASRALPAARSMRRVPDLNRREFDRSPESQPRLTVIVPARNEEMAVESCVRSLLAQDYPGLHIIAVNDRSTDATGALLARLATEFPDRMTALHVTELPAGWLGKTHAMALAARHAQAVNQPDWLLFTDADVLFTPQILRRSLALAEMQQADHFVTLPTPIIQSVPEGVLLGFLQVIGIWGTRLWRVADPRTRDAVGIGAFNMVRTSAYQRIGGFESLRLEILEDLTLARRIKQTGLRQRVAFAPGAVRVHWAAGATGVINTMTKNLFAVFHFRLWLLVLACLWIGAFCISPFAGVFWTATRLPSLLAILAIASLYSSAGRVSRIGAAYAVACPFAAALFLYSILRSAVITLRQGGVRWRGTFYSLKELREQSSGPAPLL